MKLLAVVGLAALVLACTTTPPTPAASPLEPTPSPFSIGAPTTFCWPGPIHVGLGPDPCPAELAAVMEAVAPLGLTPTITQITVFGDVCGELWPTWPSTASCPWSTVPGYELGWVAFGGTSKVAVVSLSAPSYGRLEAFEVPPAGWAFPVISVLFPEPSPSA